MVPKLIIIYVCAGVVSFVAFSFFILLLYRWRINKPKKNRYPSIVLTSHDSPQLKEKRLWSPPESKDATKGTATRAERSDKTRSYWFPKTDIRPFLAPLSGEYQQPVACKQTDDIVKGRLKFSFGYDYNMEKEKSLLTVKLHHGRDYTDEFNNMSMDSFVKTRLLPSGLQIFTSKLQRRTLNPNYNETYQFEIEYSMLSTQVLCFEVFRYDCVSRHSIFGEVIAPFKDLGFSGTGNVIKEISMSMNITEPNTATSGTKQKCGNNNDIIGGDIKIVEQDDGTIFQDT
ncbi:synaptotagmin-1-like [Dendronephthya gigantea]|uniref:synaptotagmin-1-like n=1 Tax=Dendronephthya gigantea TaxID=151771 RepID=UPI00106A7060|nr:synaptotagmin-1-like [Dendronephthya gigantea]XP_028392892.1 synaptotagmin-1-like [Dendronephthya gigantea]XP_028392899.1 synaptotagmin-1-like [Dendronephthya gigantea]XP_028392905.1 synaptotagmin-1-like [Dendronephthya gigantea]XP_028392914.1 synaptotagmin-1-like [Dendronephthya gigantea]